jgi:hypothetical protein
MGLDEDDPVTRRRMAQRLEFLTSDLSRVVEPTQEELEQFFQDNTAQFSEPDRVTFLQVFFDPDTRDEATLPDAERVLAQLREAGVPDPAILQAGDQMMLPSYFAAASEAEIRKRAGGGFASAVMALEPGQWHGPVLSGFGVHLVYVLEREQAPPPVLADLKAQVMEALQAQKMERFNEQFYEALRDRYEVIVEDTDLPPGSLLQVGQGAGAPGGAGS